MDYSDKKPYIKKELTANNKIHWRVHYYDFDSLKFMSYLTQTYQIAKRGYLEQLNFYKHRLSMQEQLSGIINIPAGHWIFNYDNGTWSSNDAIITTTNTAFTYYQLPDIDNDQ